MQYGSKAAKSPLNAARSMEICSYPKLNFVVFNSERRERDRIPRLTGDTLEHPLGYQDGSPVPVNDPVLVGSNEPSCSHK